MKTRYAWKYCFAIFGLLLIFAAPGFADNPGNGEIEKDLVSKRYTFETLSEYQHLLFSKFVDNELPAGAGLSVALSDHAQLRNTTRLAEALLFRNRPGDKEIAFTLLQWVLKYQCQEENNKDYGVWRTTLSADSHDPNWREFIGCDLIIIYHNYKSILPPGIKEAIETGLVCAARGALKRDVSPAYSNISVMSAFLMEYTGTALGMEDLTQAGLRKARDIVALYRTHDTFSEFNSPTYYGVTLIGIGLWRELAYSEEMRAMGRTLEKELWHEVATFYNANLKNMPGPYFRSYGMDMQKYNSITGLWIAVAVDSQSLAPLPRLEGAKSYEMSNIATILHLGLSLPPADLAQLVAFGSPRYITQLVPNTSAGDSVKKVTAMIHKDWMMGGLWGSRRPWGQIKTGTIHWQTANGDVAWLLVPGDGKTNVRVTETNMNIYLADRSASTFEVYVYANNLSTDQFSDNRWTLPGMTLQIKTDLHRSFTDKTEPLEEFGQKWFVSEAEEYSSIFRVTYSIAPGWELERPLLEITPMKSSQISQ